MLSVKCKVFILVQYRSEKHKFLGALLQTPLEGLQCLMRTPQFYFLVTLLGSASSVVGHHLPYSILLFVLHSCSVFLKYALVKVLLAIRVFWVGHPYVTFFALCRAPNLRKRTSSYHNFWHRYVKWWYLQVFFSFFLKKMIFWAVKG